MTITTGTATATPQGQGLLEGQSVFSAAARTPQATALVGVNGEELNFAELVSQVNRASHGLQSLGLGRGDVIAVLLPNGVNFFVLTLAAWQLGMHIVPISFQLSGPEASHIVNDSGAAVVVVANAAAAEALQAAGPVPGHRYLDGPDHQTWSALDQLGRGQPDDLPDNRTAGELMGYTSGTTGRPKGVRRPLSGLSPEHGNDRFLGMLAALSISGPTGVHLVCSPLYHAAPFGFALGSLHLGHTVIVHSKFDAVRALADIAHYQVTESHMVPTHFHRFLQLPAEVRASYDVSSLRSLVHAGSSCPVDVKRAMIAWVGPILHEYLGATEGAVAMVSSAEWLAHPGTVGRPFPGLRVELLDDHGVEVPAGEAGTIYFSNGGTSFSYHNDPDKTAATRQGELATVGDVGRFDADGYLYVLDRRVDMIVSGGVNLYPAEIENHLLAHPSVGDAVVFGVPDDEWGNQAVAVVQPIDGQQAGPELAEELLRHCAQGLAPFKKPRQLLFGPVPRTPTGKLQRRIAREAFLDTAADTALTSGAAAPVPAMTAIGESR